jgi:putative hydrolase of HD superfamily
VTEFNDGETPEAQLARDADQIALIVELKDLADLGHPSPRTWIPNVLNRLKTATGEKLARAVLSTERDAWWRDDSGPVASGQ